MPNCPNSYTLPVAVVLEYLLVQVSSISRNVVGSILALLACLGNPDTAIVGDWWTGVGGTRKSASATALFLFLFSCSFLNSCSCSTTKSMTPPKEIFFHHFNRTEHGSHPSLTTRDRELVSVLEVRIEQGDLNPRPLTQQSVTLPTLPQAGYRALLLTGAKKSHLGCLISY